MQLLKKLAATVYLHFCKTPYHIVDERRRWAIRILHEAA